MDDPSSSPGVESQDPVDVCVAGGAASRPESDTAGRSLASKSPGIDRDRSPGSYVIARIELSEPIAALAVGEGVAGLALDLRWRGRPVGFVLHPLGLTSRALAADALEAIADREAAACVFEARVRDALTLATPPGRPQRLTVAVCTRDRTENVSRWLEHVLAMRGAAGARGAEVEVLVVDNAPSDERTAELVRSQPGVRYAREPRPGLDFARNRALREATGEWIAYVDDDAVIDTGWLDGFDEAWRENPDAGAITGLVLPFELATEAQLLFERRGGFRRGFDKRRFQGRRMPEHGWYPHGSGNFGAGCNMAFRRGLLLDIGGFDDALDTGPPLPGGGDLDIFYRVARSGEPFIYEPRLLVFHRHRRDYAGLRRQYWTWGTGFMAFLAKHFAREPAERWRWLLLVRWWFAHQLRRFACSLVGRGDSPPDLVAAELLGGVVGLCGTYGRSQRRTARIRAHYP